VQTKNFNLLDVLIAKWRLSVVAKEINSGDTVLDFGCGTQGYFLKYISKTIKSGVGIDYDIKTEEFKNLKFIKFKYIEKLPFEKDSFGKVVLLAVLEHIELDKVNKMFLEFNRVLCHGGKIVLTTPTKLGKPIMEMLATMNIVNKAEIMDHKMYYKKSDIKDLAEGSGFNLISYKLFQLGINSVAVLKKA
jgi:ubiquinone/menaquinone biosynthesis C-methylase UbiE